MRRTGFNYTFISKDGIIESEITVVDFCNKYNLNRNSIGELVRKRIKTSNGWAIYDENNTFGRHNLGKNNHKAKAIIVTEIKTGVETRFDTITEASKYFDTSQSTIGHVLRGNTKTFKNKQYTAIYS